MLSRTPDNHTLRNVVMWMLVLVFFLVNTSPGYAQASQPTKRFKNGDVITVRMWWESFRDPCLPATTCTQFGIATEMRETWRRSVMAAIEDVIDGLGVDLQVRWGGYVRGPCEFGKPCPACAAEACETPKMGSRELRVNMDFSSTGKSAAAKTDWSRSLARAGKIEFKRSWRAIANPSLVGWDTNFSTSGDIFRVARHEMMHVLGFGHNNRSRANTSNRANRYGYLTGPSEAEKQAALSVYRASRHRVYRATSYDGLTADWFTNKTNLSSLRISPYGRYAAIQDDDRSIFCYSRLPNRDPAWIVGKPTLTEFDKNKWWWNGSRQTAGGVDCDGRDSEYMMTYVDGSNDNRNVVVRYSTDARTWAFRNPPQSFSVLGDPAIVKVPGTSNTWVLAYTKGPLVDWSDEFGVLALRVSTDDGNSWGEEIVLDDTYRSHRGPSIAASSSELRIAMTGGVARSGETGVADYGSLRIATASFNPPSGIEFVGWKAQSERLVISAESGVARSKAGWITAAPMRFAPTWGVFGGVFDPNDDLDFAALLSLWPASLTVVGRPDWWTQHLLYSKRR